MISWPPPIVVTTQVHKSVNESFVEPIQNIRVTAIKLSPLDDAVTDEWIECRLT